MKTIFQNIHDYYKTQSQSLEWQTILFVYFVSFIELILILYTVPLSFITNDDPAMNSIASGAITGKPSEFLIFTNILIGYVLKYLYGLTVTVNWYTWYMVIAFYLGFTTIQLALLQFVSDSKARLLIHLILLSLLLPALLYLQFTQIAAICAAGGFLLLLVKHNSRKNLATIILAIVMIGFSVMIRKNVLFMYILLSAPFFFYLIYLKAYKIITSYLIAIAISFGLIAFDQLMYKNHPEFDYYRKYNSIRAGINMHDTPYATLNNSKNILKELKWSENDFQVASSFLLDVGHPKYTQENILQLKEHIDRFDIRFNRANLLTQSISIFKRVFNYWSSNIAYLIPIFFLMFFMVLRSQWKGIITYFIYVLYIIAVGLSINLILTGVVKERILWSLLLSSHIFLLFIFIIKTYNQVHIKVISLHFLLKKYKEFVFYTFLIITILTVGRILKGAVFLNSPEREQQEQAINEYLSKVPYEMYVNWCDLKSYNPLKLPPDKSQQYELGWLAGSPFNKTKICRYTLGQANGIYTIYNKEIVWFFRNNNFVNNLNYNKLVEKFYTENYSQTLLKVDTIPVSKTDTLYKYSFYITK